MPCAPGIHCGRHSLARARVCLWQLKNPRGGRSPRVAGRPPATVWLRPHVFSSQKRHSRPLAGWTERRPMRAGPAGASAVSTAPCARSAPPGRTGGRI